MSQQIGRVAFEAYERPLETVTAFISIERILKESYDNWPEVFGNLQKERKCWARISRILRQKGIETRNDGTFYKAVVQATLLLRAET